MKRFAKIFFIALGGVLLLALAAVGVAVWWIFTPEKLTPVVRTEAGKYLSCQTEVGTVDLTFFSTFPEFGLRMSDVVLLNPMEGAQSDTLAALGECVAIVNVMDYLNDNAITIRRLLIDGGQANIYVASDGSTNYDIAPAAADESVTTDEESSLSLSRLSLAGIEIADLTCSYVDRAARIGATVDSVSLTVAAEGDMTIMEADAELRIAVGGVRLSLPADTLPMDIAIGGFEVATKLSARQRAVDAERLTLWLDSLTYADGAMSARLCDLAIEFSRLHWDSLPSAVGEVTLRELDVTTADGLSATAGAVRLSVADAVRDTAWHVVASLAVAPLTVAQGRDIYINEQPLRLSLAAEADTAFSRLSLPRVDIGYAGQELALTALVTRPDTAMTVADVTFSLSRTTLQELWSLVPRAVTRQFMDMRFAGSLDLSGAASVAMIGDDVDIRSFNVKSGLADVDVAMGDNLAFQASRNTVATTYPAHNHRDKIETVINLDDFRFRMTDSTNIDANLASVALDGYISDDILRGSTSLPAVEGTFAISRVAACVDTLAIDATGVAGRAGLLGGRTDDVRHYSVAYANDSLAVRLGRQLSLRTGVVAVEATVQDDPAQQELLLRFDPKLNVDFRDGVVAMEGLPCPIDIPAINFDFDLGDLLIHDSRVRVGRSDFGLQGNVSRIRAFLRDEDLLTADLRFTSDTTDVYQLMDLVSGFGTADSTASADTDGAADAATSALPATPDSAAEADPFIVPKGVDVTLNTHVAHALVGPNDFTDLAGKVTIRDGVLVLEEMGFSSKAARMQLTAMYNSDLRNHLFVGANFHLLDIEIADLIQMIPDIDTIVPMLKSFDGKAEFHLAAETNLTARYDIKMSTLKATAAIEGRDLVLMDSETFSTISKYLFFNKKTENKVDSLSVEMAVNRRKATIYPFLITMDKYQAVVAGSHNITDHMGFNYNISITDWPLPAVHPGLDVTGDMENLSFKLLAKGKYVNLYKPQKRNATQAQTLELKAHISKALKRTVKEQSPAAEDSAESTNTSESPQNEQ